MLQRRASRAQEPNAVIPTEPLNAFEQQRADNIARNQSMLANLGIPLTEQTFSAPGVSANQGANAAGNSKGKFIGGSSSRRRKRVTVDRPQNKMPCLPLPPATLDTSVSLESSGITVILVEGSPAVACDMATWMQPDNDTPPPIEAHVSVGGAKDCSEPGSEPHAGQSCSAAEHT